MSRHLNWLSILSLAHLQQPLSVGKRTLLLHPVKYLFRDKLSTSGPWLPHRVLWELPDDEVDDICRFCFAHLLCNGLRGIPGMTIPQWFVSKSFREVKGLKSPEWPTVPHDTEASKNQESTYKPSIEVCQI